MRSATAMRTARTRQLVCGSAFGRAKHDKRSLHTNSTLPMFHPRYAALTSMSSYLPVALRRCKFRIPRTPPGNKNAKKNPDQLFWRSRSGRNNASNAGCKLERLPIKSPPSLGWTRSVRNQRFDVIKEADTLVRLQRRPKKSISSKSDRFNRCNTANARMLNPHRTTDVNTANSNDVMFLPISVEQ
jgi:hypothetical protein